MKLAHLSAIAVICVSMGASAAPIAHHATGDIPPGYSETQIARALNLKTSQGNYVATLKSNEVFIPGSAEVANPDSSKLAMLTQRIDRSRYGDVVFRSYASDSELAQARAEALIDVLARDYGMDRKQVRAEGYASSKDRVEVIIQREDGAPIPMAGNY